MCSAPLWHHCTSLALQQFGIAPVWHCTSLALQQFDALGLAFASKLHLDGVRSIASWLTLLGLMEA
jgi:hypothetical protein